MGQRPYAPSEWTQILLATSSTIKSWPKTISIMAQRLEKKSIENNNLGLSDLSCTGPVVCC